MKTQTKYAAVIGAAVVASVATTLTVTALVGNDSEASPATDTQATTPASARWHAESDLAEAVFLGFINEQHNPDGYDDELTLAGVQAVCDDLAAGVPANKMIQAANSSDDPEYARAVMVGATVWYCPVYQGVFG